MLGRDSEYADALERAHHAHLGAGRCCLPFVRHGWSNPGRAHSNCRKGSSLHSALSATRKRE